MFMLYGLVAGLTVGLALGGRPDGLGRLRLRWVPLVMAAMAIQAVLFWGPVAERVGDLGRWLYVGSTGLAFAAIVRNARVPGLGLVAAGAASNLLAIVANGGSMPASPAALAAAGHAALGAAYSNSVVTLQPALAPLTDVFALPRWLPFANIFSVGDAAIAVGVVVTVACAMRLRPDLPPETAIPARSR